MLGKVYLTKSLEMSLRRNLVCTLTQLERFIAAEQVRPRRTEDQADNNLEGRLRARFMALSLLGCFL